MFNHLKKYGFIYLIVLIFVAGAFLRAYHFSDWLHFELDQSRDAKVIDLAVDYGIGNLPLLGPKAAGSFLWLGPIFYYFEYLGAKIFGGTPAAMASFNLIFSILAIPLFYLFVRRFFSRRISVALLSIFSISLFLILYSRFAWNPNSLPFFILLTFYALLRMVDAGENKKGRWVIVASAALAITTQLHFVAFLAIPIVVIIFLLLKRQKLKFIHWMAAILIFIFFYIPPIINDIKTGGANIKEFKKAFIEKSDPDGNSLVEKIIRNYTENAVGYFLIATSSQKAELPKLDQKGRSFEFKCNKECKENAYLGTVALAFFTLGILMLVLNLAVFLKTKACRKKDFIMLVSLWFGVSFVVFTPIAYDFAPRFFLIIAALPFIFLGFVFNLVENLITNKKVLWIFFSILLFAIAWSNLSAVKDRFYQMSRAPYQNIEAESDPILKEDYRITLEQQYIITDYMETIYQENNYPVYVNSESFYRRAFIYHLKQRNIPSDDFRNNQISKMVYNNGNYFLIHPINSNLNSRTEKYLENYQIVEQRSFGTLVAIRLTPKGSAINAREQKFGSEKKDQSAFGVPVRCRWNEIFSECNPDEPEEGE